MAKEIDYAAVLADMEARRAVLEAAIAGLRLLVGQGVTQGMAAEVLGTVAAGGRPESSISDDREIAPGTFHGMSVSEAARKFLEMKKTKQRTKDISEALQRGGIESISDNFYGNVFTTMARRKDFIKLGKFWALAEWYPNRAAAQEKPAKKTKRRRAIKLRPPAAPAAKASATTAQEKAGHD